MAAFNKKKMISENLRGNYFFHICNLFYERTKFFLFGGSFQYRFQSRKQGILQKNFLDRSINRSIVAFQRTQAINFSASWPGLLEAWLVLTSVKYHGNLYILIPLNQRLALTRLRATGPWLSSPSSLLKLPFTIATRLRRENACFRVLWRT